MAKACSEVFHNPRHRRKAVRARHACMAGGKDSSKMDIFNGGAREGEGS